MGLQSEINMQLIARVAFSWAHRGIDIEHFQEGQIIETDDADLAQTARDKGWAESGEKSEPPSAEESTVDESKPTRTKRATK